MLEYTAPDTTVISSCEPALAAQIEAEHQAAHAHARSALVHAFACGRLLIEAKAAVGHGGWLAWLGAHTTVTPRQSQRYMQLAAHREVLEAKSDMTSHLTQAGALAQLAAPGEPTPEDLVRQFMDMLTSYEPFETRLTRMTIEEVAATLYWDGMLAELNRWDAYMKSLLALEARIGFEPGEFCAHVARLAAERLQGLEAAHTRLAESPGDRLHPACRAEAP